MPKKKISPERLVQITEKVKNGRGQEEDVARVLAAQPEGHRYLLPDVCLTGGVFLDGKRCKVAGRTLHNKTVGAQKS